MVERARQYKLICRNRLKRCNYFMLHQDADGVREHEIIIKTFTVLPGSEGA